MKLKGLTKKIAFCAALMAAISTVSYAGENRGLAIFASLEHKSNSRCDNGSTSIDNPVNDGSISISNGKWDVFTWTRYNTETEDMNEVDFGVGYSFIPVEDLNVRLGLTRWKYLEGKGKNDVLDGSFVYAGLPVVLGLNATQVLDQRGTQITGIISQNFDVAKLKEMKFSVTPMIRGTFCDDYFGSQGYTNTVYSLGINAKNGSKSLALYINQHDGTKGLDDDTQVGFTAGYSY